MRRPGCDWEPPKVTKKYKVAEINYAHLPSSAISAAPSNTQKIMNVNWRLSLVRSGLNRKSRASSSTKPVYSRMPAETESRMPETMLAVKLPGLYVVRTPRPIGSLTSIITYRPYGATEVLD